MGSKIKFERLRRDLDNWTQGDMEKLRAELDGRLGPYSLTPQVIVSDSVANVTPVLTIPTAQRQFSHAWNEGFSEGLKVGHLITSIITATGALIGVIADIGTVVFCTESMPENTQNAMLVRFLEVTQKDKTWRDKIVNATDMFIRTVDECLPTIRAALPDAFPDSERDTIVETAKRYADGVAALFPATDAGTSDGGSALRYTVMNYGGQRVHDAAEAMQERYIGRRDPVTNLLRTLRDTYVPTYGRGKNMMRQVKDELVRRKRDGDTSETVKLALKMLETKPNDDARVEYLTRGIRPQI